MMGRLNHDQGQLFYSFHLDEVVPDDHLVREIAAILDLSWVHRELAAYYPKMGRPSIDPELMCGIRAKAATDSDGKRPPNPSESGHRFRSKAATLWIG